MTGQTIIVALDGPSGVGKSTVAPLLAARLGLPFLETGAMYRAVGLKVLEEGVEPHDRRRVEALAAALDLRLEEGEDGIFQVLLDGRPLSARTRSPRVSEVTSMVSTYPGVRRAMVALQRDCASRRGAVVEGRDIGSKVFPETPYKFFLEAPQRVRVARRREQLRRSGEGDLSLEQVASEVTERDRRDAGRADSPLRRDDSYELVDTGELGIDEVVERLVERIGQIRRKRDACC